MSGRSALIIGATGAVGRNVLRELLASKEYTRVGEYGRRLTPKDKLGEGASKLEQKEINFDKVDEEGLKDGKWDVVFLTLGTTRGAAGSAAAFEKIDREYVVNSARAAKSDDPTHEQRVIYCSSSAANAKSSLLYPKSKGLTENALAELGYKDTVIFRPGYLANAERSKTRVAEAIFAPVSRLASFVSSNIEVDVRLLGKAMVRAGIFGSGALPSTIEATKAKTPTGSVFTVINNKASIQLSKA